MKLNKFVSSIADEEFDENFWGNFDHHNDAIIKIEQLASYVEFFLFFMATSMELLKMINYTIVVQDLNMKG